MNEPHDSPSEEPIVIHGPVHGDGDGDGEATLIAEPEPDSPSRHIERRDPAQVPAATPPEETPPLDTKDAPASARTARRAHSLDALRGLFLVLMTLGFTIYGSSFPPWMYHRQMPPPGFSAVNIPGIAWRDLAFAAFLFTMAAALPLTLSRRIEKGELEVAIMLSAVRRYLMLMVFALLVAHASYGQFGYTGQGALLVLLGFVIIALIYTRPRADWSRTIYKRLNVLGWAAAAVYLALTPQVYDGVFSLARNDEIIRGLAFASLSGSIIWYFTRDRLDLRLIILAFVVALHLGAGGDGWIQDWWWYSPIQWIKPADLGLLAVVIPGTIAGEVLLRWMRAPDTGEAPEGWPRSRAITLALLCLLVTPVVVVGLYNRWVLETTQAVTLLLIAGAVLTWRERTPTGRLLKQLFLWGALWLVLGLLLEPAEGGIKKVPATLSYLLTVTGLTTLLLVAFSALLAGGRVPVWARPFRDVGVNPLLGYVAFSWFLNPLLGLVPGLVPFMRGSLPLSFLRSVIHTILVILIVQAFTRARIYWRT